MVIINTQMQNNKFKAQAAPSSSFKCSCHAQEATCWALNSKLSAGQISSRKSISKGIASLLLGFSAEVPQPRKTIEPASSRAEDLLLCASALCESSTGGCAAHSPWCLPDLAPSGGRSPQIRLMPSSPSMQSPRSRATSEGWMERAGLRRAKPASVRGLPWRLRR